MPFTNNLMAGKQCRSDQIQILNENQPSCCKKFSGLPVGLCTNVGCSEGVWSVTKGWHGDGCLQTNAEGCRTLVR